MSKTPIKDYKQIVEVIGKYVEGLVTGKKEVMKPAFHEDATMYGYNSNGFLGGPIQNLWDFVDKAGAAPDLKARIDILDVEGTIATARISLENDAYGESYTDYHQLLKVDGEWKVIGKVFHLHG
ncbi:nuclear transport factor 2 family protein [Bacillus subtilis]|uniref:nuclear transport factor 2 family protein n=1 Tax=Bacillus subtilis TaxID=1423 RepID=UPI0012933E88|nr:nuclear transport factor 2 family protein [Bacillus subtilis]MCP6730567.1 nuclear transport factor 2 family protein [Bacillus subtilis]MDP0484525.1 nuclear transport factor 2 family protein [Bacillus subtilis]QFY82701.1 nuclear transport factor 2 family protein [Bacillus subtilis]